MHLLHHALISCRLDYCNYILYNVPKSKTDRLQRLQNQCARILTKSPRREHITPVLKKLHWLKILDRIIYNMLMLTYKSYYNMAPPSLCELINKKESHVNTHLGTDHHQLIMPPISKDCSNTFLERSFIYSFMLLHATIWMLTVNVYIIVIYDVITVDYCKSILLFSPLNSYLYVHWILDFKLILLLVLLCDIGVRQEDNLSPLLFVLI